MARYMRTDLGRGHSKLVPPAVVGAGIAWHGPGVYLRAPSSPNQYNRRRTHWALRPPTVLREPEAFYGPDVHLTQPRRTGPFHSALRPPAVIGAGKVNPGLRIKLTFGSRGAPKSHLSPPAVVTQPVTEVFSGPPPTFAPQRRGRATYDLAPPIVIDSGAALGWLATTLAPQRRGQAKSFLGEPVVAPAVVVVYFGPQVHLVRRRTPAVRSVLRPPTILQTNVPTAVTLAPQRRGAPHSFLQPPRVVLLAAEIYGPEVHLTRIKPQPTFSVLRPPAVVTPIVAEVFYGPVTKLAESRRGQTMPVLRGPVVVTAEEVVLYGLSLTLAPQRRPITKSVLRAPAGIGAGKVNPGLRIKLTFSQRGVAKSQLFPPAVAPVVAVAAIGQLQVNLTYSRRGRTLSGIGRGPRVVVEGPQGGVLISLAPQRRGLPKSRLRQPVVVTAAAAVLYPQTYVLTYSRRGRQRSFFTKPAVVFGARVNPGLRIKLAFGQRRRGVANLLPPATLVAAVVAVYYGPQVTLAPQRRGKPKSFLRKPVAVFPFFARKTEISLAPQSRGVPHSFLRLPQVVRLAVEIYGPETWLTYSRRGRPQYRLEPPAVVGKAPFRGIKTWLTRIKPRPTVSLIKPPSVVRVPTAGQLQVHLTYSRRGRPVYFQTPFTPGKAPFRPIQVHLTRLKPRPTAPVLRGPVVIGAGIAFFGPSVTLVRIKHPPVQHNLRLTLVAFRRPGGDVCGFDIAGAFVCYLELPGSQVSGSERAGAQVSGSSRAGSSMTGSESEGGSVSGSDRKAT